MSDIESFPPIADVNSRILILGSIPGVASLEAGEYYAHPRNQFWRILGELLGFDPQADYRDRIHALLTANIAVWDVVKSCHRPGSLDAAIHKPSIVANDFPGFFHQHPTIESVLFNGATAEQTFRRLVLSQLPPATKLALRRLPSTSPANAGMDYRQKLQSWRLALGLENPA